MQNFWLRVQATRRAGATRRKLGAWGVLAEFGVDDRIRKRLVRIENLWLFRSGVLLVVAMSVSLWLAGRLSRFADARLPDWVPAWTIFAGFVVVAFGGGVLAGSYLTYARGLTGPGSILQELSRVVVVLDELRRLQRWTEDGPVHLRPRNVRLRVMRSRLRAGAWSLSRQMAMLLGLEARERDDARAATLGRWLCWASEDLLDPRRTDDALRVCAEAVIHFQGPLRFTTPKLSLPPSGAVLLKPRKHQRVEKLTGVLWTRLVIFIPVIGTVVGAVITRAIK